MLQFNMPLQISFERQRSLDRSTRIRSKKFIPEGANGAPWKSGVLQSCGHNVHAFAGILLFAVVGVLFLDLARTAFTKIGFTWGQALFVLLASLLGSGINIPVTNMQCSTPMVTERYVRAFGVAYRIPVVENVNCNTILAVNFGGAVIPVMISIGLLYRFPASLLYALAGIALVAIVINRVAKPVKGLGIVTPALLPPLVARLRRS